MEGGKGGKGRGGERGAHDFTQSHKKRKGSIRDLHRAVFFCMSFLVHSSLKTSNVLIVVQAPGDSLIPPRTEGATSNRIPNGTQLSIEARFPYYQYHSCCCTTTTSALDMSCIYVYDHTVLLSSVGYPVF